MTQPYTRQQIKHHLQQATTKHNALTHTIYEHYTQQNPDAPSHQTITRHVNKQNILDQLNITYLNTPEQKAQYLVQHHLNDLPRPGSYTRKQIAQHIQNKTPLNPNRKTIHHLSKQTPHQNINITKAGMRQQSKQLYKITRTDQQPHERYQQDMDTPRQQYAYQQLTGSGLSPNGLAATIKWLTTDKTRKPLANKYNVSTATLTNQRETVQQKINEYDQQ